jgi:hypothetical protein
VARSPIQDNLKRAAAAGLAWPLAEGVTEDTLERQLFGRAGVTQGQRRRAEPDWAAVAREVKRPGVTMTILWEEYREVHPEHARRLEPHLCRGDLDADVAGLDRAERAHRQLVSFRAFFAAQPIRIKTLGRLPEVWAALN